MTFDLNDYVRQIRLTDGAWGTQLQRRGLAPGSSPELWNVTNPSAVKAVAESYVKAGSDVILTNTFGANRFILASHGLENRAAELTEAGVKLSKVAAGSKAKVFASIGPTGKIVMMEEISPQSIASAFSEAAEAAEFGGADAIVLETFNELDEIRIALNAVKEATDLPVIVSMTFASGPDKTVSMMGNSPNDLARMAVKEGADAVGANCGVGPDNYVAVARQLRQACNLPIWIKANAGLPQVGGDGRTVFPMSPKEFAAFAPKLVEAGANFIGGCCGTSPAFIEDLRAVIDQL